MILEWREHRNEPAVPVCQRKDAKSVEDVVDSVGDGGKQPGNVALVDTLREEGDNSEKLPSIRAEFLEHGGGEGKINCGSEALFMPCLRRSRSLFLPLSRQPIHTPLVLMCDGGEQGGRQRVEVKLFEDVVY